MRLEIPVVAASLLLASTALHAEVTRTLELALDGDAGGSFAVENLAGEMTVRRGPGAGVVARVTVHAESDALANAVRLEQVEGKHQIVTLRVRYPEGTDHIRYPGAGSGSLLGSLFGGGRTSTRYDGRRITISSSRGDAVWADVVVELPASVGDARFTNHVGRIEARGVKGRELVFDNAAGVIEVTEAEGRVRADTGSGDVSAAGIRGRFACDTGSGACRLDGFEGDEVECDTGSGRIEISAAKAERIQADTGSGEIRIVASSARRLELDTGSGDVHVETDGAALEQLRADTGSGDVTLALGANASFELRADVGSGEVRSGFADAEPIRRRNQVIGYRRGDARSRIAVDTGSGDVRVRP
jgi:hypothetical protein